MKRLAITTIWGAAALLAAPSANAPTIRFEQEARVISEGRSPKLLVRRQHGLQMLTTRRSPEGKGFDLFFTSSSDLGDSWSAPLRVNSTPGEVSDHGENSPILLSSPDGATLYAVWNARDPKNPSGTHVKFSRSSAMNPSWSEAVVVNDDPQPVSHSFQGAAVAPDGSIYVAWLDARERAGQDESHHGHTGGTSALYISRSTDGGRTWGKNVRVAGRVCPCCRASVGFSRGRVHVSWRGVDDGDLRDIYVASSSDGGATWGKPVLVARDGWKINGCPHVGASLATLGDRLYVAWFSEAQDHPAIFLAYSDDGGEHFQGKQMVSENTADPTHPFLASGDSKLALVFQARDAKQQDGWGKMAVYYREVDASGKLSPLVRAGEGKLNATFPTVALGLSNRVFVAWTQSGGDVGAQAYLVRGRRAAASAAIR